MAGSNGELYHYGRFDTRTQRLEDLAVYSFGSRGWNVTGRRFARVTTHMNAHTWRADLGWQRTFGDRNAVTAFSVFPTKTVTIETPDYFGVEKPEAVLAERLKVGQLRSTSRNSIGPGTTRCRCRLRCTGRWRSRSSR